MVKVKKSKKGFLGFLEHEDENKKLSRNVVKKLLL